jgi:DNA-directed RNA polymerase subunit RPC12/RpoP
MKCARCGAEGATIDDNRLCDRCWGEVETMEQEKQDALTYREDDDDED